MEVMAVRNRKRVGMALVLGVVAGILLAVAPMDPVFADQAKSKAKATVVRMGVLSQVDSQFVIKSGRTTYRISGRDLSPWVGKKVKATGTMTHSEKSRVLEVIKIEEAKGNR
jgi:hypothetical protein